jgi:mono/diheme cytochrome c family protein
MAVIQGCRFCHTTADERAQPLPGMTNAGGRKLIANGKPVYTSNITPDAETGIGAWTEAQFVARFKDYAGKAIPVSDVGYQTQHAWTEYAKMSERDLADIYAYLMAQPAVRQLVDPVKGIRQERF